MTTLKQVESKNSTKKPWDWLFLLAQCPRLKESFCCSPTHTNRWTSSGDGHTTPLGLIDATRGKQDEGHNMAVNDLSIT